MRPAARVMVGCVPWYVEDADLKKEMESPGAVEEFWYIQDKVHGPKSLPNAVRFVFLP